MWIYLFTISEHLQLPVISDQSRQLQSRGDEANCTPPAVENFPAPLLSRQQRQRGGLLLHALLALYMFWGLAIVCDEYFVPSCERICDGRSLATSSSRFSDVLRTRICCSGVALFSSVLYDHVFVLRHARARAVEVLHSLIAPDVSLLPH